MKPYVGRLWVAFSPAIMLVVTCSARDAHGTRYFNAKTCYLQEQHQQHLNSADPYGFMSTYRWQEQSLGQTGLNYNYENNIHRPWMSIFSQSVVGVSPNFSAFQLESGYDFLRLYGYNQTSAWSGLVGPGHWADTPTYRTGNGFGTPYVTWRFDTDYSVTSLGYYVSDLRVTCGLLGPPENSLSLQKNYPYDVYLLDTLDVAYVKVTQPAGHEMGILIWPESTTAATDFDLYVSTSDPFPDPNGTWTWKSTKGAGKPDMVLVPPNSQDRTIFIAVASFSGAGKYRLYANSHASHDHGYNSPVGVAYTDYPTSPWQKDRIHLWLRHESVSWYLATEGNHFIKRWDVYYNLPGGFSTSSCNPAWAPYGVLTPRLFSHHPDPAGICYAGSGDLDPCPANPPSCQNGSRVQIGNNWCRSNHPGDIDYNTQCDSLPPLGNGDVHEFGHCIHGFVNEVTPGHGCGHSIMSNNYFFTFGQKKFCTPISGGRDEWDPEDYPGHPPNDSNWWCMASHYNNGVGFYFQWPFDYTPDGFSPRLSNTDQQPFVDMVAIYDH